MKYRAFISYSHHDRKWARWLHRKLEGYRPPRHLEIDGGAANRRLRPIFRDRDELSSASDLSEAVQLSLAESEWLIVICSPNAAGSRWVNEEVRTFQALGRASRILCFLVEGEPGTNDLHNCFPPALTAPAEPGGRPREPVAADARPQGDGRKNAMLKIAAGMLGVGFDALRQRDLRRRQRRLVGVAAASLAIAGVTVVLAIYAWIARNEAQQRRAQAEDLIGFMLGDLREHLREIGRLDVFESVGDKALEYFAGQDPDRESDRSLAMRARNLQQIGEVRMDQGQLDAAIEAFNASLRYAEQLVLRTPEDPEASLAMANGLFYLGYVHWQRGELAAARGIFESIIPVVDGVSAGDPDNPDWLVERAYANTNLGRVRELEGDYEAALAAYQSVMEVNERLLALEPENPEWELELGFAHNNLGKLLVALGQLDAAEGHYRTDLEIKADIHSRDPNHNVQRSYLGVSQYYLGQLLVERGDYAQAEALFGEAQAHFRFLNEVDPDRKRWRVRRANIERELGKAMALSGRTNDGLDWLHGSVEELQTLIASDPDNTGWRRDLVATQLVLADFETRRGAPAVAAELLAAARRSLEVLLELEPTSLETQALAAHADVCTALGADRAEDAEIYWDATLERLDRHFPESRDPRILELRAAALTGLGDGEAAYRIVAQLDAMGYEGMKWYERAPIAGASQ